MLIRERSEENERRSLHKRGARASESGGRVRPEAPCDIRTAYQRDRDRILHSKSFRRLKHKTQVFLAPRGDHYRTRLTHTLEVSQIGRTIARALRLNEDLTEAIALGHDLGHTPFGHAGEEALNEVVSGGFSHVEQSIRVVEVLEKEGRGLNLTAEVRDGISRHSKGEGDIVPPSAERAATLEGQVVRLADIVAYLNHDIDDALRAGVITAADVPDKLLARLGGSHAERIGALVRDVIEETMRRDWEAVAMSAELGECCSDLRTFLYRKVYFNPDTHSEFTKASALLRGLYGYLVEHPEEAGIGAGEDQDRERLVCDFIAGMTDRFATMTWEKLFLPQPWKVL